MTNLYWSDPHFGHANIIKYCSRPFATADEMDKELVARLLETMQATDQPRLVCGGDLSFNPRKFFTQWHVTLPGTDHVIVYGNHDPNGPQDVKVLRRWFTHLVGGPKTWEENAVIVDDHVDGKPVKVLVSHAPQADLRGCDYNVYGHVHDKDPGFGQKHLCACVELTEYRPVTLRQLLAVASHRTFLR